MRDRDWHLEAITTAVGELLDGVTDRTTIDWRPTREGLTSPAQPKPLQPGASVPKPTSSRHVAHLPGLVHQLSDAVGQREPVAWEQAQFVLRRRRRVLVKVPVVDDASNIVRDEHGVILMRDTWQDVVEVVTDAAGHPVTVTRLAPARGQHQLAAAAAVPGRAGDDSGGGRRAPDSAAPPGAAMLEAAADLAIVIQDLYATEARWLSVEAPRTGIADQLRALVGFATLLPDQRLADLSRQLTSAARSARIALGLEAAVVDLPDVGCPDCGGQQLRARADASGPVWCDSTLAGPALEGHRWPLRCGAVWPRHTWPAILTQLATAG